jgi:glycerol-3-phosphate acyltransferase PlsY
MDLVNILKLPALVIFAYMLGSVPCGFILTKLFTTLDIRQKGSGNIGATNVRRIAGNRLGIITLAGDVLKGAFPVYLAIKLTGVNGFWAEIYISLIAVSALSGHLFPVFLKFKGGGKGVATAAGCFMQPGICRISWSGINASSCCMEGDQFKSTGDLCCFNINTYLPAPY